MCNLLRGLPEDERKLTSEVARLKCPQPVQNLRLSHYEKPPERGSLRARRFGRPSPSCHPALWLHDRGRNRSDLKTRWLYCPESSKESLSRLQSTPLPDGSPSRIRVQL